MARKKNVACECCGDDAVSSIEVFDTDGRLYLPEVENVKYREEVGGPDLRRLSLCHPCMRFVEDNFRASVAYLKDEKGLKFRTTGPVPKQRK